MNEITDDFKMDLSEEEIDSLMKDMHRHYATKVIDDVICFCRRMQEAHGTGLDILKGMRDDQSLSTTLYENIKTLVENPDMPYEIRLVGRDEGTPAV